MKDGILIIDKKKGITSRDVVNIACKRLNTKKIGHTGTLDPIATGVLVLGINNGTKIIELLTSNDKEYIAECILGIETDSLDLDGNIIKNEKTFITEEDLKKALYSFNGTYLQEVPKYSAIKINGKKLYEYARNNISIELPKREVTIANIKLLEFNYEEQTFKFSVSVSKGTYIRSLIRDIGEKLNTVATMKNLRRTRQGIFTINNAIDIDEIDFNKIISIKDALNNYPSITLNEEESFKVRNGVRLNKKIDNYTLMLDNNKNLIAIYEKENDDTIKSYRVFGGNDEKD